jgi:drug/metabolite transporter (DMT)-like permease
MAGIEAAVPGGERLHAPTILGMAVGFLGAALLVAPGALGGKPSASLLTGFLILQLGNVGWCLGSVLQKRAPKGNPVVTGAIQQFAAGLAYLIALAFVKTPPFQVTAKGAGAVAYLVTFGSIVAFTAYLIALQNLPVTIVSTYAYVNPVVAVILGSWIYREPFGWRESAAMAIIFTGVWMVKRFSRV